MAESTSKKITRRITHQLAHLREKSFRRFKAPGDSYEVPAKATAIDHFVYQDLDEEAHDIRLLRILPRKSSNRNTEKDPLISLEIYHTSLDDKPSYKTLSYTWGNESDPMYQIYLNGARFEVRENLYHALRRLQSETRPIIIWIDALCISQTSNEEKNHQVAMMKSIYEQATEVIVWLGESYDKSDEAINFVQELYDHRNSVSWIDDRFAKQDARDSLLGLGNLIARDYWKRIWVVQELIVAPRIVIYCGSRSMTGECFDQVQRMLRKIQFMEEGFATDHIFGLLEDKANFRTSITSAGLQPFLVWKAILAASKPSFFGSLLYHFYRTATDPRDMIYGLAALANQTSAYIVDVDYSLPPQVVFTAFATQEIEVSRKLDILTRVIPGGPNPHNLPSWVPDWSRPNDGHLFLYTPEIQRRMFWSSREDVSALVTINNNLSITFTGIILGTITTLSHAPSTPRPNAESLTAAQELTGLTRFWEIVSPLTSASKEVHAATMRTLVLDRIAQVPCGLRTQDEILLAILGYLEIVVALRLNIRTTNAFLSYWEHYLNMERIDRYKYGGWKGEPETHGKRIMFSWITIIINIMSDRMFFRTANAKEGLDVRREVGEVIGLAYREVRVSDLVVVPLGCCHPLVLRRVESRGGSSWYTNLGEAYAHGFMRGEILERELEERFERREFEVR